VIETYLAQLEHELDVPRRLRRRIVDEARDHLCELSARGRELGLGEEEAERQAVAGFGRADAVAREFHEQLASASAHRSSSLTALVVVAMLALCALVLAVPISAHGTWAASGPYALIAWFGGQVAVVAGALAVARSLRYRADGGAVPSERLADIYRPNAVALACAGAMVIALAIGAGAHVRSLHGGWALTLVAGTAALGLLALAAAAAVTRSLARARPVAVAPRGDAVDDMLALALLVPDLVERRSPRLAALLRSAGLRTGAVTARVRARAPRLAGWLDLRAHPWCFCGLFATACGLAVGLGHVLTDGGGPSLTVAHLARSLLAVVVLAAIEGVGIAVAFLVLGRFLGIRREPA
jgi:HAAS